jgi:hypothetical protein
MEAAAFTANATCTLRRTGTAFAIAFTAAVKPRCTNPAATVAAVPLKVVSVTASTATPACNDYAISRLITVLSNVRSATASVAVYNAAS